MNLEQRAQLVREMKQRRKRTMPGDGGRSRDFNDDGLQIDADPRQGESRSQYFRRRNTHYNVGGDASMYDMAARWDRHRASQPRLRRAFMRRAPRDPGGYVGYTGNWRGHFGKD